MNTGSWKRFSLPLMILSLIAVILAVAGALGTDLYLASTQWMLVAIFLAVLGIYTK